MAGPRSRGHRRLRMALPSGRIAVGRPCGAAARIICGNHDRSRTGGPARRLIGGALAGGGAGHGVVFRGEVGAARGAAGGGSHRCRLRRWRRPYRVGTPKVAATSARFRDPGLLPADEHRWLGARQAARLRPARADPPLAALGHAITLARVRGARASDAACVAGGIRPALPARRAATPPESAMGLCAILQLSPASSASRGRPIR